MGPLSTARAPATAWSKAAYAREEAGAIARTPSAATRAISARSVRTHGPARRAVGIIPERVAAEKAFLGAAVFEEANVEPSVTIDINGAPATQLPIAYRALTTPSPYARLTFRPAV